jgi:beta-RFAP synthase
MIEAPGIRLTATTAADWSADGPLADRALEFARRFAATLPAGQGCPQHFRIEQATPEHAGLGTGTQLGLAVARAIAVASGLPGMEAAELARRIGRGARSALGVHGFAQGGFLVEGGKRIQDELAPLVTRLAFPEAWRVIVALPPGLPGVHGNEEALAFAQLYDRPAALARTEALCRLVLLGMLPALVERDLDAFGEALHDFNRRAGDVFAGIQRGPYAGLAVTELVQFFRSQGVRGVGQSSWGPAVFAVVGSDELGQELKRRARKQFGLEDSAVWVSRVCDRGATVGE